MKLGHVHLKVRNISAAEQFYTTLLGLEVTERVAGRFVFLSFGSMHHDLALQQVGEDAAKLSETGVGLYHSAFETPHAKGLYSSLMRLRELAAPATLVDHRISWAIYTRDPDGNGVEIYLDRRHCSDGGSKWEGHSRELTIEQIMKECQ